MILTGDHERVARNVAQAVGRDNVAAGLLPEQKVLMIHDLMQPPCYIREGVPSPMNLSRNLRKSR